MFFDFPADEFVQNRSAFLRPEMQQVSRAIKVESVDEIRFCEAAHSRVRLNYDVIAAGQMVSGAKTCQPRADNECFGFHQGTFTRAKYQPMMKKKITTPP